MQGLVFKFLLGLLFFFGVKANSIKFGHSVNNGGDLRPEVTLNIGASVAVVSAASPQGLDRLNVEGL